MLRLRNLPETILAKANSARDTRHWRVAAELYKKYLNSRSDDASIWVQLGHALKESGDLDGAERAYVRAITLCPSDADTFLQMGHLLKIKGRIPDAVEHYRRAYELQPSLESAVRELIVLGANPESPDIPDILELLPKKVDVLSARMQKLEEQFYPAAAQISAVLDRASAVKAFGFEMERQKRVVDSLGSRLAKMEEQIQVLLVSLAQKETSADDARLADARTATGHDAPADDAPCEFVDGACIANPRPDDLARPSSAAGGKGAVRKVAEGGVREVIMGLFRTG